MCHGRMASEIFVELFLYLQMLDDTRMLFDVRLWSQENTGLLIWLVTDLCFWVQSGKKSQCWPLINICETG